jgi:hypothetical protein
MQLWVYLSSAGFASASIAKAGNGGAAAATGSTRTNGSPAQVGDRTTVPLSSPHAHKCILCAGAVTTS